MYISIRYVFLQKGKVKCLGFNIHYPNVRNDLRKKEKYQSALTSCSPHAYRCQSTPYYLDMSVHVSLYNLYHKTTLLNIETLFITVSRSYTQSRTHACVTVGTCDIMVSHHCKTLTSLYTSNHSIWFHFHNLHCDKGFQRYSIKLLQLL